MDTDTLTASDPRGVRYKKEVDQIKSTILNILPGAFVQTFAYTRQVNSEIRKSGAWGKGAVSIALLLSVSNPYMSLNPVLTLGVSGAFRSQ